MIAVIFDKDGVLDLTEPLHEKARREELAKIGYVLTHEDYKKHMMSRHFSDALRIVPETVLKQADHETFYRNCIQRRYEELWEAGCPPVTGIEGLVFKLKKNPSVVLGIASTQPRITITKAIERIFPSYREIFQAITSGEDCLRNKPYPDVYIETAKKLGVSTGSCVAIEDSPSGVTSATRAGMTCLARINEYSSKEELESAGGLTFTTYEEAYSMIMKTME